LLSNQLGGFDLSEYDLDGPLPDIPERQFALSGLGNTRNIIRWAREEGLTVRQIYQRFASSGATYADRLARRHRRRHGGVVSWLRRRRFSVSSLAFVGRA
jgi:hypothetical protein